MSREDIFGALFDLSATLTWGSPPRALGYRSRRVRTFADITGEFPAFCQAEHDETHTQTVGMPAIRTLKASWIIYQNVGTDPDAVPATETNLILDAIEALFPTAEDEWQSLGGLAYSCMIDGKVFKDPGDLDGIGLLIVPLSIVVP